MFSSGLCLIPLLIVVLRSSSLSLLSYYFIHHHLCIHRILNPIQSISPIMCLLVVLVQFNPLHYYLLIFLVSILYHRIRRTRFASLVVFWFTLHSLVDSVSFLSLSLSLSSLLSLYHLNSSRLKRVGSVFVSVLSVGVGLIGIPLCLRSPTFCRESHISLKTALRVPHPALLEFGRRRRLRTSRLVCRAA
ncbi:hypothetical protein DFP72DRAFT_872848 [Ephemerocybe angulata]|uniref:Uncharacterized protein n=1 Tax=Ephemerocybe angulata TaxID=980116 RepID=A0A8H6IDK4_9AGAR|nr:hypothetical protein DFP72DRAFT_872848 [Tulosesus angulatus]